MHDWCLTGVVCQLTRDVLATMVKRVIKYFKLLLLAYEEIRHECHNISFLEVSEVHSWQVVQKRCPCEFIILA